MSLAVHGAVVATLALTMLPWAAPDDDRRGQIVMAHLEAFESQVIPEPAEMAEPVTAPDDDAALPVEEFDLPSKPVDEWVPAESAPAPKAGTSLLETVVFPRIRPNTTVEDPAPPVQPEPIVLPETLSPETLEPRPAHEDSSPEPVADACPPPAYPRVAERRGWTGTVVLLIDVALDGTVTAVRIESSSGHTILDEAAVRAVKLWRFAPALTAGLPTAATVRKPIRFGAR